LTRTLCSCVLLITTVSFAHARPAPAADFASADAARQLTRALDAAGVTAIAAADPAEPGRFVAALYIPGSQLLVVSARHPSVDGVAHRIATRQYREVYLDLQGSPTLQGKFFVQDAAADGILSAEGNGGDLDVLYEDGVTQTLFNGDSEAQDLTSSEYEAKLSSADARYARLLMLLTTAVGQMPDE
jgi:hypothetical protein